MLTLPIRVRRKPGPKPTVKPQRPRRHHGGPGPRPLIWCTGPDPVRHQQFVAYGRAKCQALWRGEGWLLTFEQYELLWRDRWHLRGRTRDTLCLSRIDYDAPWSMTNCEVITRRQHNQRQAQWRMGKN